MKSPGVPALLAFTLLAAPQAQAPASQDEPRGPDRTAIAVLRADGIILPFAAVRGSSWSVPWPGNLRSIELPVNLEAVPDRWWGGWKPESWHAWLTDGRDAALDILGPTMLRVHCDARLGVRTDYQSPRLLPRMPPGPFPKDGIAVSDGLRVDPLEIVEPASADRAALAVALLPELDRAEEVAISMIRGGSGWQHPFSRQDRRRLPVRIESWYRTPADEQGWTVSYIEAVRSYPAGPEDEGCGLETVFSGWIHQPAGESRPRAQLRARVTYCDRVGAVYMLPFGRIHMADRLHWIFQLSGWDEEWYVVAQVHGGRVQVVAEYFGGGRASCR